jgi:hypothetical protein
MSVFASAVSPRIVRTNTPILSNPNDGLSISSCRRNFLLQSDRKDEVLILNLNRDLINNDSIVL